MRDALGNVMAARWQAGREDFAFETQKNIQKKNKKETKKKGDVFSSAL